MDSRSSLPKAMKRDGVHFRALRGSAVGVVGLVFNLVQGIVQVPLLLHFWDTATYGTWMSLLATIGIVTSVDIGHQSYIGNLFNESWVNSRTHVQTVLSSSLRAAIVLGGLEVLIGGGLVLSGGFVVANSGDSVAFAHSGIALSLYLLYWGVFGAIGGILVRLYLPAGRFARSQWLGLAYRSSAFIALVIAAASGGKILAAMAAQVAVGTVYNILLFQEIRNQFPELYPWWRGGNWDTAWKNLKPSFILTGNGIGEQLASNGLVLLVGKVMAPSAVALFTTVRTLANIALQGSMVLLNPLIPDMVRYHVQGEGAKLVAVFSASWLLGNTLVSIGLAIGMLALEPLYLLWTGGVLPLDRSLFAGLGLAVAIRQWAIPFQIYLSSINRLRPQTSMVVARAVLGLGIAAVLLPSIGLLGAGLGVLVAEIGAAFVAGAAARRELRQFGIAFPIQSAMIALAQIALASAVLAAYARQAPALSYWSAIGVIGICVLAWCQWRILSVELRVRLLAVASLPWRPDTIGHTP